MKIHTLIHTALVAEAKPIIGHFKLSCTSRSPYNLYIHEDIALIVSGIGSEQTKNALSYALALMSPQRAINVGIAGCSDTSIEKGTLFCASHQGLAIPFASLSSRESPMEDPSYRNTTLVDMEAQAFMTALPSTIEAYVFKVVSDHLETSIPSKADVGNWIGKSIKQWENYVRG